MLTEGRPEFRQERFRHNLWTRIQDLTVRLSGNELGLEPTGATPGGWHLCHPKFDPHVRYEPKNSFTVEQGADLIEETVDESMQESVRVYTRFGRVLLDVNEDEKYYLRRQRDEKVNSDIVILFHPMLEALSYVGFKPSEYKGRILVTNFHPLEGLPPAVEKYLKELKDQGKLNP